ncbi:MAG: hypothetical protein IPJ52_15220 [Rhodocyclaceae bacterium]|jgi:hypothetical protein|nr:hypothetical protein [Rhodocyclaceae bacterium]MBK6676607.1 hypothetical protein [Rhodocyclaceae bacterium]MBK7815523.1 hypothetical protein [Rhodocyclaceae bacterium]MBK9309231.1 hypothetical protein [Rhodocyclaceae bacterium]
MHPNLSFEQAPPVSVPYRFFLTAPLFGVAAGLLLVWLGESAVASRWSGGALALTHLLAVGFMLQAMTGAVMQFVPVAAGGNVWRPGLVANLIHPALAIGAGMLVAAFLVHESVLFRLAGAILLTTVGFLVVVVGAALLRTPARGATILSMRIAVFGLAVTALLGATLAEGLAGDASWPLVELANVHAGWGLGGWALMLLAGVSYYVVPMFQLTPAYPAVLSRWLAPILLVTLLLWSVQLGGQSPAWQQWVWRAGLAVGAGFAGVTLWLQQRRRRRVSDPTLLFFRGAMVCMIGLLLSAVVMTLVPSVAEHPRLPYWLGVLALPGVFVSAINGMLYKIVPFLNWLHLQRLMGIGMLPPNMKEMIAERAMVAQMRVHFAAVIFLLAGAIMPEIARVAGLVFAISCAMLGRNLIQAARFFRNFRDRIRAAAPNPAP